jgi:hypothetical protein
MRWSCSVGIGLALLVLPGLAFGGDEGSATTPKDECDLLVNVVVPFARQMLSEHHGFFPFGATMSPSGAISRIETPKGDHPPKELVVLIEQGFVDGAQQGLYKATAVALDVKTVPPGKNESQNAVEVRLDHRDHYSVKVVFPYSYSPSGQLDFAPPFAVAGDKMIFAPSAESKRRPPR